MSVRIAVGPLLRATASTNASSCTGALTSFISIQSVVSRTPSRRCQRCEVHHVCHALAPHTQGVMLLAVRARVPSHRSQCLGLPVATAHSSAAPRGGMQRRQPQAFAPQQNAALPAKTAVVIVDHGSRKKDSNDMLVEFGKLYQDLTRAEIVEVAHMEIAEPSIEQAVAKCAGKGAVMVVVAPYFLSRGRHIQEDIPALIAEAQAKHPGVKCVMADPIGIDPLMVQLISNRVTDALATQLGQPRSAAPSVKTPQSAGLSRILESLLRR